MSFAVIAVLETAFANVGWPEFDVNVTPWIVFFNTNGLTTMSVSLVPVVPVVVVIDVGV